MFFLLFSQIGVSKTKHNDESDKTDQIIQEILKNKPRSQSYEKKKGSNEEKVQKKEDLDWKSMFSELGNHQTPSPSPSISDISKDSLPKGTVLIGTTLTCKEGYVSDGENNIDIRGCWKCPKQCGPNERCGYPGECFIPVPQITKLINSGIMNKRIILEFIIPSGKFRPQNIYCRFNDHIVPGNLSADEIANCPIPNMPNIKDVSLSFDQKSWSNIEAVPVKSNLPILIICFLCLTVLFGFIFYFIIRKIKCNWKRDTIKYRTNSYLSSSSNDMAPMAYFPQAYGK